MVSLNRTLVAFIEENDCPTIDKCWPKMITVTLPVDIMFVMFFYSIKFPQWSCEEQNSPLVKAGGESVRGTDRNCKLFLENVSVQLSDFACCFWDLRRQRLTKSSKKGWGSSMSSLVANQESWIKSKGKHGTSQDGQKPMAFRHLIYLDLIKAFDKHDLVVWQNKCFPLDI